jgi:putative ABC transport system permease protein
MDEEMSMHLERATERYLARGLPPDEAKLAARHDFGSLATIQDAALDARGGRGSMERLLTSWRQTLRRLTHEWRYTSAVVLVLAIGIGPTAAVASVIYNVLLRPLDYREPDRLGFVRITLGQLLNHPGLSRGEASDIRDAGIFEGIEIQNRLAEVTLGSEPDLVPLSQMGFSPGMLSLIGVSPLFGRDFVPEDLPVLPPPTPPGTPPAPNPVPPPPMRVLLDYSAWQTHFGGERNVVGRIIRINGANAEVIGVLPDGFRLVTGRAVPQRVDIYTAIRMTDFRNFWGHPTVVRLRDGMTFQEAELRLATIAGAMKRQYPDMYKAELKFSVTPLLDDLTQSTMPALRAAGAAVLLLFIIAFANATALVVARQKSREVDLAVRSALGARSGTLIRAVVMESTTLAAAGALAGGLLAMAATAGIREIIPRTVPRWDEITIGWEQVGYSAALTLAGLIFLGLIPAFRIARGVNFQILRSGSVQGGRAEGLISRLILVGSQMAFTVVLAFGCVQLARSASGLRRVDLGFDPNVLTFRVPYDFNRFSTHPDSFAKARAALYQRIRDRVGAVPGVTAVGVVTHVPLSGSTMMDGYEADLSKEPSFEQTANYQAATPGYFNALRIPIIQGRDFTDAEDAGSVPVIVVDETLVAKLFPGEANVVGRTLRLGWGIPNSQIIGVVGHARTIEVARAVRPQIYTTIGNLFQQVGILTVRTSGDPRQLRGAVERAIAEVGPGRAISGVSMLTENVAAASSTLLAVTGLVTVLTVSAGLLCAVGLYLVVAYVIHQHRRANAIRTALGASPGRVVWDNARTSGIVAGIALPIGILLSLIVAPFLDGLVYGVSTRDLVSIGGALILAAVAAALGTYFPARRASRANILGTLRES